MVCAYQHALMVYLWPLYFLQVTGACPPLAAAGVELRVLARSVYAASSCNWCIAPRPVGGPAVQHKSGLPLASTTMASVTSSCNLPMVAQAQLLGDQHQLLHYGFGLRLHRFPAGSHSHVIAMLCAGKLCCHTDSELEQRLTYSRLNA